MWLGHALVGFLQFFNVCLDTFHIKTHVIHQEFGEFVYLAFFPFKIHVLGNFMVMKEVTSRNVNWFYDGVDLVGFIVWFRFFVVICIVFNFLFFLGFIRYPFIWNGILLSINIGQNIFNRFKFSNEF